MSTNAATRTLTWFHGLQMATREDDTLREHVRHLPPLLERLLDDYHALEAENQRLRDELAHLQGQAARPIFPASPASPSSEGRRPRDAKARATRRHRDDLPPTEVKMISLERTAAMPADLVNKGYADFWHYNLRLTPERTLVRSEVWYDPQTGHTYTAPRPPAYAEHFGPELRALAVTLWTQGGVSFPTLAALFDAFGVPVAEATLVAWTGETNGLAADAAAILEAGLATAAYHHVDATSTRVGGQEQTCHVLTGPSFAVYYTTERETRQSLLDLLRGSVARTFVLDERTYAFLTAHSDHTVAAHVLGTLRTLPQEQVVDEATFTAWLTDALPALRARPRQRLLDAAALAAYHRQPDWPTVRVLVCDDAHLYRWVATRALCWVHEGRHYAKLTPHQATSQALVEQSITDLWGYYRALQAYQRTPTPAQAAVLEHQFDTHFARTTGYAPLDRCLRHTLQRKTELLTVLAYPWVPLHNNPAELVARQRVRKRDVSFGPRNPARARVWDMLQTVTETAKKLGVSVLTYLTDRFSGRNTLPSLATLIRQHTPSLLPQSPPIPLLSTTF